MSRLFRLLVCWGCCSAAAVLQAAEPPPFYVRLVDDQTGRGVPLVELRTTNEIQWVTDSHGVAVIDEPGFEGLEIFLHISSHGYEQARDGFGMAGRRVRVQRGKHVELPIRRTNVAERLYRVTGGGIYRDSLLAGLEVPLQHPALNGQVLGSDSVQTALYQGRIHWFWGDTSRPSYPLGNFHTTGAVSRLPSDGGLPAAMGVKLDYFTGDDGFARAMAPMAGQGPTWIDALTVVRDADGGEQMFAAYAKVRGMLETYRRGFCRWDPQQRQFVHHADIELNSAVMPAGHSVIDTDNGKEYVYFADPFPLVRVPATAAALTDVARYEAFTCLFSGSTLDEPRLDRDAAGRLRYAWRQDAPYVDALRLREFERRGLLKRDECPFVLYDADDGRPIVPHRGSVYFNPYRNRWVLIVTEQFGTSMLGEVWYAEADKLEGPWAYATKIISHNAYSFYNPKQHPYLAEDGGRTIYFEGTYTTLFSGNQRPTPRYEYNQIMYRLDLLDARLHLPVAVYGPPDGSTESVRLATADTANRRLAQPLFFACDRPRPGTAPIRLRANDGELVLYALPADLAEPPAHVAPLWELVSDQGHRRWTLDPHATPAGFQRQPKPVAHVWKTPFMAQLSP